MPNNNNGNKKQQKQRFKGIIQSYFGDEITHELRQLIDLAVRKQFDTQQFVERFANTHYFHQKFPGLIEKNGSIANGLTGAQGVGVSASSLGSAISAYEKGLNSFQQAGKLYGVDVSKGMFAHSLNNQVSAQEFQTRLQAIDTVNSNPDALAAFQQQMRAQGIKVTKDSAYRAAAGVGDRKFLDIYEAASYQSGLGLSKNEATNLAKKGAAAPGGATFQSIDQVVEAARQNLQSIGPELRAQGIGTPQLVKILNNPSANPAEMEKIRNVLEQRKGLFGRPVAGTYAQQGQSGGLSQYPGQQDQAYG